MYCHENTVNVLAPDTEVVGNDKSTLDDVINFDGTVQDCLNEWKNELCLNAGIQSYKRHMSLLQKETTL